MGIVRLLLSLEKFQLKKKFKILKNKRFKVCLQLILIKKEITSFSYYRKAICKYLVDKYGQDDSLYPKDLVTRAKVDRILFFDESTLFAKMASYFYGFAFFGEEPCDKKLAAIHTALELFEKFLEGHDFAVGNQLTIADFCLVSTVSTMEACQCADLSKYKNVHAWFERCKLQVPDYETQNNVGVKQCRDLALPLLAKYKK